MRRTWQKSNICSNKNASSKCTKNLIKICATFDLTSQPQCGIIEVMPCPDFVKNLTNFSKLKRLQICNLFVNVSITIH